MDENKLKMSNNEIMKPSKVVIIGDTFVGKTSILNVLLTQNFSNTQATIGASHQIYNYTNINNESINLDIWDTAGQERFKCVTPMYYRGARVIIVVFDITIKESFESAKRWVDEIETNSADSLKFLVGNKMDLEENRLVLEENVSLFAVKHNLTYYETSAKTNTNIKELFENIADRLIFIGENRKIENISNININSNRFSNLKVNEVSKSNETNNKSCCN